MLNLAATNSKKLLCIMYEHFFPEFLSPNFFFMGGYAQMITIYIFSFSKFIKI